MKRKSYFAALAALAIAGCGADGDNDPTDVRFGDTALVVVVNPTINDANGATLAEPGTERAGISLTTEDGLGATTDSSGLAVLGPLNPGTQAVTLSGAGLSGSFSVTLAAGELREVALAADGNRAEVMVDVDYKTELVTEITPDMSAQDVDAALAVSDTVLFVRGGSYQGDLDFSGSRVTLFGEGILGGEVTIDGNVTISGSDSRIRGTRITGNLDVSASGVGLSFSRVDGDVISSGSDATFLANALCGATSFTGSDPIAVGNAGAAPVAACP